MTNRKITKTYITQGKIDSRSLKKESFATTIKVLKVAALKDNNNINNDEIAKATNLTMEQFNHFLETDEAPETVFQQLRDKYHKYLQGAYFKISFVVDLPDPLEDEENLED